MDHGELRWPYGRLVSGGAERQTVVTRWADTEKETASKAQEFGEDIEREVKTTLKFPAWGQADSGADGEGTQEGFTFHVSSPHCTSPQAPDPPGFPSLLPFWTFLFWQKQLFPPILQTAWLYNFRKRNFFELPFPPFQIRNTALHPPLKSCIFQITSSVRTRSPSY